MNEKRKTHRVFIARARDEFEKEDPAWNEIEKLFKNACSLLEIKCFDLEKPEDFEKITGNNIEGNIGFMDYGHHKITVLGDLSESETDMVIHHELAHAIFPEKPHWWVEVFAHKVSKRQGKGTYTERYNHSNRDLPNRKMLIIAARERMADCREECTWGT